MNKPITLCDRCKEYVRCCLNYDGDNCRRIRTVEPTNADRIRAMSNEELAEKLATYIECDMCPGWPVTCEEKCTKYWLDWLKQEVE